MRAPKDQNANLPPRAGSGAAGNPNVVETAKGERAEILSNAPVQRVDAEDVGRRDGLVRGSAVDPDAPPERDPTVLRWVVLRDAQFTDRGHRVKLTAGKEINSLNYDFKHLVRQGVKLKKLEPGEDAADVLLAASGG